MHQCSFRHQCIVVKPNDKGVGVYAKHRFIAGDVIDDSPVLLLPLKTHKSIDTFSFEWRGDKVALALSRTSFLNHSYQPNVEYRFLYKQRKIRFVVLRSIKSGEELTINYNGSPNDLSSVGFEVK
jgi:uncharacterized protein